MPPRKDLSIRSLALYEVTSHSRPQLLQDSHTTIALERQARLRRLSDLP
jgi:hypothetical protein